MGTKFRESHLTMSERFLDHYLMALQNLQRTWMSDEYDNEGRILTRPDSFNRLKFEAQVLYLIHLLPDASTRTRILEQWKNEESRLLNDKNITLKDVSLLSGMCVVSELILFLTKALDLATTDVCGPATEGQFIRSVLELPEREEQIDVISA